MVRASGWSYDIRIQKEIQHADIQHTVIIVPPLADIVPDDDFGEGVAGQSEGPVLDLRLLLIRQGVGGLDIDFLATDGRHKVDFPGYLNSTAFFVLIIAIYNTNIHRASTDNQIVIDDIFHNVGHFLLTEADPGISQTNVLAVILVGVVEVALAL